MPFMTCQPPWPSFGPARTPKSVPTYSVCVASSRTMSDTGRSPVDVGVGNAEVPLSTFRLVNVPEPETSGLPSLTSKTWPGVAGVVALNPEYEIHAWDGSFGSGYIPLGYRVGE